jgi:protein SHQ1
VDETLLTVHINPYYLRLNFSNPLLEDDESSAQYDVGSGYLTVTLTKARRGEEFKDLDLLAKLLAPKIQDRSPIIEVISTQDNDDLVKSTASLTLEERDILEGDCAS